ncbi:hypothetical protein GCM10007176_20180 [Salinicoccus roseus]|jgi:hypothetical protein|nr:hypothetical protein EDC33_2033 [Salinicoccus roseus]GGA75860.1 hypothetical protein GCM10007176_20180 [Salinicoccus roseus]
MKKCNQYFYRGLEVEVLETDIEFDLVLVKILPNKKVHYISKKLLTLIPNKENFISIRLLREER